MTWLIHWGKGRVNAFSAPVMASAVRQRRWCLCVPLFHCFGCVIGTMSALASGAAIIMPNWTFDPRATLQAVQAEKADDHDDRCRDSSLRKRVDALLRLLKLLQAQNA